MHITKSYASQFLSPNCVNLLSVYRYEQRCVVQSSPQGLESSRVLCPPDKQLSHMGSYNPWCKEILPGLNQALEDWIRLDFCELCIWVAWSGWARQSLRTASKHTKQKNSGRIFFYIQIKKKKNSQENPAVLHSG